MGRPVYPHELSDPDFSWLISHFQENNPEYCTFEHSSLPVVFIYQDQSEFEQGLLPYFASGEEEVEHAEKE